MEKLTVPRGLLEQCLGIIEETQKHFPASGNFTDEVNVAVAQLKAYLHVEKVTMHLYHVMPIDQWSGWQEEEDFSFVNDPEDYDGYQRKDYDRTMAAAKKAAAKYFQWEGDMSQGPFLTGIPGIPGDYRPDNVVIAWKQSNNGDTYVVSPIPLSYLEDGYGNWITFEA